MNESDTIDFREFTAVELQAIYDAIQTKPGNEICAEFGRSCRDQLAAAAGKLVYLHEVGTDIDFTCFSPSDLSEALVIFRGLAKKFKATNKRTPATKRFCEMIIVRCRGGLEAQEQGSVT
jgi:hypothetical protein